MNLKKVVKTIMHEVFPKKKVAVPKVIYSDKKLDGKIALITGGSSGIGFSIADEFIKNGCKVIICGTNENKLRTLLINLVKCQNILYLTLLMLS